MYGVSFLPQLEHGTEFWSQVRLHDLQFAIQRPLRTCCPRRGGRDGKTRAACEQERISIETDHGFRPFVLRPGAAAGRRDPPAQALPPFRMEQDPVVEALTGDTAQAGSDGLRVEVGAAGGAKPHADIETEAIERVGIGIAR